MSNHIRRTAKQIEHLKAQISELNLKGYTQIKIAEKLGISQQMVSHYLEQIEAEVQQRIVCDRVAARQQQIDNVRLLKSNSWDAIQGYEEELQKNPENRSRTDAAMARERRFILQCLEVENKLLGLYEKYEPAVQTTQNDLSQFSADEIEQYMAWSKNQDQRIPSDGQFTEVLQ